MLFSAEQLIEQIHDSPRRIVLAAAGGGSRAIADLLEVPGGSRTLLEAIVPYSAPAMIDWLGGRPDEFCSAATARAMAMAAFQRARRYEEPGAMPAGVACAASLASDRPKRGSHRVHLAMQTTALTAVWSLQLHKDRRTRAEEERLAGRLLLNVVAEACDVPRRLQIELLEGEQLDESRSEAPSAWQDLLLGQLEIVRVGPGDGPPANIRYTPNSATLLPKGEECCSSDRVVYKIILSGAFNPWHAGHRRMAQVAEELLRQPVALEISILNVDKPPLDYVEIQRRVGQFPAEQEVYLTRAATFEEKSRLFAGATFLVGVDTLERIASPRYYDDNPSARQCAIQRIANRGCRFLVFGRDLGAGFVRLGELDLPDPLRALCREVPPETFHKDISSTELRKPEAW